MGLHFAVDIMDLSSFNFFVGSLKRFFSATLPFGRSRSSKVIDFITNRKRICDFLLVRRSNLGPILHRFRDIARFVLTIHPYSTLILRVFQLDQIARINFEISVISHRIR